MGSIFFEILDAGSVASALNLITDKLSSAAETIKLPTIVMLALGAIVAVLVGTLGYKYIKLLSTICFAIAGYGLGGSLFEVAKAQYGWNVPDLVGTIVGVAMLLLLAFLAYKKFAYALFGVACFTGFILAYFIYPDYIIAIAAGVVVAMLSMYFVRYAFVIITSFGGGFAMIAMLSAIAPQVALLKLDEGFIGTFLAVIASLFFVSIQFTATHNEAKKHHGPRRVKIRRVFDAW